MIDKLQPISNLQHPKELLANQQLQYANDLLGRICERIELSDLRNDKFFQVIRYEYCYSRYLLTNNKAVNHQMANQLFDLFVGTKQAAYLPYYPNRPLAIESIPHRLMDLLQILSQHNEGQKMLDLIAMDTVYTGKPIIKLFQGMAFSLLLDTDNQIESLKAFLTESDNIDELDAINFLEPIRILIQIKMPIETIYQIAIDNKRFKQLYYKSLLEAFIWIGEEQPKLKARVHAEETRKHWTILPPSIRNVLAKMYFALEEWTIAKELLSEVCNENEESDERCLYIIAIFREGEDIPLFLQLVATWRENYSPRHELIHYELRAYRQLHNYAKVEEVATYAFRHFPDSIDYWFDLVRSLYAQRATKKEALVVQLAPDRYLYDENFTVQTRFSLAHMCFIVGHVDKGLELSYRTLKANPDNPSVEQAYFGLSTNYEAFDNIPNPEVVQQDMVVRLRLGNDTKLIELTQEAINHNRIAQALINRRVGDIISLKESMTDREEKYTIEQIFDKYTGQFALTTEKIETPFNSLSIRSIKIDTDESGDLDIERFHKQLQELVGTQGTKRKIITDHLREEYTAGKIGFIELCQGAFEADPIATWEYITSDIAGGIVVVPTQYMNISEVTDDTRYVLDFTSVLSLFSIEKLKLDSFTKETFIVSQFLIDHINNELEKAQNERGSTMSAEILIDRVIPYFYPENQKERRINFYQDLSNWVSVHCEADYAPERLGREFNDLNSTNGFFSEERGVASSLADSLLLSSRPNRFFVTDDLLPYRTVLGKSRLVTTELFLQTVYPELYMKDLWIHLVSLNYRGLTLDSEQLFHLFMTSLLADEKKRLYQKVSFSFSKQYNQSPRVIMEMIRFMKKVYNEDFTLVFKRQTSQALIRRHFVGTESISRSAIIAIRRLIDSEFKLMGDYGSFVKEDFDIVVESGW